MPVGCIENKQRPIVAKNLILGCSLLEANTYMPKMPTIEEMERFILDSYRVNKIKPGEMLPAGVFLAELLKNRRFSEQDFRAGMRSLIEKGIVKEVKGRFFLTELGQKAI